MTLFTELSQYIRPVGSFDRSTNLELDFEDQKRLRQVYISEKFEAGILEVLDSVSQSNSNQRVRVLSGSPGLGKSTFAVVLLNLLEKTHPRLLREIVATASTPNRKHLQGAVDAYLSSKKQHRLLAVFLNGYMGDIEQAFLSRLRDAFRRVELEHEFDKVLATSYDGIEVVASWQDKYPEVFERYTRMLAERNIDAKNFKRDLAAGHSRALRLFSEIYREVTGGAAAQNATDSVVDIFKQANKVLADHGFAGVYVVYDEFGKYLEQGIHSPSKLNIQFLQDFAEYCDRSGANQCHLMLITHMSVSQYATKLPVAIQKEWAKIEGRFQENAFYDRSTNYYQLITRALQSSLKDDNRALYSRAKSYYTKCLEQLGKCNALSGFVDTTHVAQLLACYPLHPLTLAYLPILSQRVAQNERTLYTFLTRKEPHSLPAFLDRGFSEKLPLLMPSHLYEYFAQAIEKDTGIGGTHRVALIMDTALKSLESGDLVKREILSLLGLSEVIRNPRFAPCDERFFAAAFAADFEASEVRVALKELTNRKLILFNRHAKRYELMQGSAIDIDEELEKLRTVRLSSRDLVNLIGQFLPRDYVVPNRYNLKHRITRFFRRELLSVEELHAGRFDTAPNYDEEDGIIYTVIPFDQDELTDARRLASAITHEMVIFVVPEQFVECRRDIEELKAISALHSNKEILGSSPLVKKELDLHHVRTLDAVLAILRPIVGQGELSVEIIYRAGEVRERVASYPALLRALSIILEKAFSAYPIFNSELIVRNKPSANITIARRVLIDAILSKPQDQWFGIVGDGPEKAIAKALLATAGHLAWQSDSSRFALDKASSLKPLLDAYTEAISADQGGASYRAIIAKFTAPPFGIRRALLPLYLSVFDRCIADQVNHYFAGEFVAKPDGDHYELLAKNPKDARIQMTRLSDAHAEYLKKLSAIFGSAKGTTVNEAIAHILAWRRTIPDYVKLANIVSTDSSRTLVAIDSAREPDRLLFAMLPAAVGFPAISADSSASALAEVTAAVARVREECTKAYAELLTRVRDMLADHADVFNRMLFGGKLQIEAEKLATAYQDIVKNLPAKVKAFQFKPETTQWLERIRSFDATLPKQYFIETIGDVVTGKSPRSWGSRSEALFEFNLLRIREELGTVFATFAGSSRVLGAAPPQSAGKSGKDSTRLTLNPKQAKIKEAIEQQLSLLAPADRRALILALAQTIN